MCLRNPTPGMGRKVVGSKQESFKQKYFDTFPGETNTTTVNILCACYFVGKYFTGDWAYRDIDGDYQIVGRKDDIVRIKGIWIQVPEIESSIVVHSL